MKNPKQKAEELVSDYLQMQPNGLEKLEIELSKQYEFAKLQSEYTAMTVKHSHNEHSKEFQYWSNVQKEIKQL